MDRSHYFHNSYRHPVCRSWHSSSSLKDTNLILPIFVTNTPDQKSEIASMPGNFHYGYDRVVEELRPLIERTGPRLRAIMLFGVLQPHEKEIKGNSFKNSPVIPALERLKSAYGQKLLLCVDICLCGYTTHGHCGVLLEDGTINLAESQSQLAEMSVLFAQHGADVIAPSDMMDGRVFYIKEALLQKQIFIPILSYSSKFKSSFYGPFRDAANSAPAFGDRAAYQLPSASRELAIRAALRDIEEGADFVMVKPAMPYLDIIRDLKNTVQVPICCYQVSGEFAMIYHAAQAGGINLKEVVLESMQGFLRAGAQIIITYFTPSLLDWIAESYNS
ncbi:unnamed protein product [Blepharisma stoltei]|uniref:Delta-aminolevulinic acid dehydratase n=1 Tax=Blepharisma stoltei TaxID=1481888 RepID=A0AAU9JQK2_9CILI|nr:unnamed protein product [Blepharisma stoltei]